MIERGEIWWCDLPEVPRRPVVVLSRTAAVVRRRRAIVAPCTTRVRNLPSEVALEPDEDPVPRACVVNMDSVESVPIALLTDRLGRLSSSRMHELCAALAVAVECE